MDLVEREGVLAELGAHLEQATRGRGRLVLLRGEAGIGKTAVVRRFAEQVGARARVLTGGCDPLSTPCPLGPLTETAAGLGPAVEKALAAALESAHGTSTVFRALLTELGARPTVLVFEDLHWADAATLDLLRYLGRHLETSSALVLATYRDDEIGPAHPLRAVLGDLAGCPAVHRCEFAPLSRDGVAALAAGRPVDAEELHRITRGNPFFVTEVLTAPAGDIPATVREAVLGRLARLPGPARSAVDAVAVVGSGAPLGLLRAVLPEPGTPWEEALALGVLHTEGPTIAFRHELARIAVLEDVPAYRRVELHRRVLAALRSAPVGPSDLSRLAYHAEESGESAAVLEYARAAAAHASAMGAHREAADQYGRALRHADALPPGDLAALLEGRAFACTFATQVPEAIGCWQRAAELRRALDDGLREGDDLRWLSFVLWPSGRRSEAEQVGRQAVAVLARREPGPELAWAYVNLADLAAYGQDLAAAETHARQAVELGERLGEPAVVVRARFHVALARVLCGGDGWAGIEQAWRAAVAAELEVHAGLMGVSASGAAVLHRDLARAGPMLERTMAYCLDHNLESFRHVTGALLARTLVLRGRWAEAAEAAHAALGRPELPLTGRLWSLVTLALVRARRGEPQVWPLLDEAATAADPTDLFLLGPVWEARAEAAWLDGEDERAVAEAGRGLAVVTVHSDPWLAGGLSVWARRGGARPPEVPAAEPFAAELAGAWQAAAAAWDGRGCAYEAALARLDGDASAVHAALTAFEALGARPAAARARAKLKALGVRVGAHGPRPATRANRHGLTRREQEICGLLRQGLSGPEIAARLYISPKTVGRHVEAILSKLGAHTRAEALRTLGE
ncbi:AAA family ATPase [Kitasatospora sp. NPDC002227]|uniref:ATP-binding protein n=1 Tax=Kitasatospora sp. NPDC002227 TaxID=3154773 RepID=UPI0033204F1E